MMLFNEIQQAMAVEALGWTLLHSIWQGMLLAFGFYIASQALKGYAANSRYWLGVAVLIAMVAWSAHTFSNYYSALEQSESASINIMLSPILEVSLESSATLPEIATFYLGVGFNYYETNMQMFLMAWIIGVILFSIRLTGGLLYIRQLRLSRNWDVPSKWQRIMLDLKRKMGIRGLVKFAESELVHSPLIIGYLKPVILFPAGVLSGLSTQQVEAILVHELAHIRRQDYLVNILQSIIETLFFYNPFMWYVSSRVRLEREHCCDDMAVQYNEDAIEYAKALTELENFKQTNINLAMAATGRSNQLFQRIKRLLGEPVTDTQFREKLLPAMILVIALASLFLFSSKNVERSSENLIGVQEVIEASSIPYLAEDAVSHILSPTVFNMQDTSKSKGSKKSLQKEIRKQEQLIAEQNAKIKALEAVIEKRDKGRESIVEIHEDAERHREIAQEHMKRAGEQRNSFKYRFNIDGDSSNINFVVPDMDLDIHLKMEALHEAMAQLDHDKLRAIIHIDEEKMEEVMEDARKALDESRITIEKNVKVLEKNMEGVKRKLKVIERRHNELEGKMIEELVKDGLMKKGEKNLNIDIEDDVMKINGKKLTKEQQEKYEKLMDEFMDFDFDFDFDIDVDID